MQLMMYIGNDLIEAVPLNLAQLSQPGYLGRFKRNLKQKYFILIEQSGLTPEFLVVNPVPAAATKTQNVSSFHISASGNLHAPGLS
jgi:hypothetical protein